MDDIVERLRHIGLNTYEAKVYLALLKHHPATGYEISKNASVPQARAYDTLKALETQKMVVSTEGKPVMYMPVSPEEILSRFERQYQGSIDYLRSSLPAFAVESIEPVHNLRGSRTIYDHAVQIIDNAKETIFMELWREDEYYLEQPLRRAAQRGVSIYIVGYHQVSFDFCRVYHHDREATIETLMGERWLLLAADAYEGLIGVSPVSAGESHALWTKNPTIVLVIKELVVHDIFLLDVEKTLREPMEKAYGPNILKLRNKILGDEVLIGAH